MQRKRAARALIATVRPEDGGNTLPRAELPEIVLGMIRRPSVGKAISPRDIDAI
jgi:hypothetical protein